MLKPPKSTIFREIKRIFWGDDAFPKKQRCGVLPVSWTTPLRPALDRGEEIVERQIPLVVGPGDRRLFEQPLPS